MQTPRFIPPLNLDRAMFLSDPATGKPDTKYLDDRHYRSRLNTGGLSTTASLLSPVSHVGISPTSTPPRPSGTELSPLYFPEKKNENYPKRLWKLFTRKAKRDKSQNLLLKSATTVKKHRSTPDLKESWVNFVGELNANPSYPHYHAFPPVPPTASSATSFIRTSSERSVTDHPTIILVIDDNWDTSSADFPLQRVEQTIPMDITDDESSECSSHPDIPQHHPIRGQRRRAETSKSSRERWDNASFLNMDAKNNPRPSWI